MVKRLEKHRERQQALSLLGKDLARRARRQCELCDAAGVSFVTWEVAPVPAEPLLSHCLLLCTGCRDQLDARQEPDASYWRFLEAAAWKELPAIQVTAVRVLNRLPGAAWAVALLDSLYLSPEAEVWLAKEN